MVISQTTHAAYWALVGMGVPPAKAARVFVDALRGKSGDRGEDMRRAK